jgi:hypothetical protein
MIQGTITAQVAIRHSINLRPVLRKNGHVPFGISFEPRNEINNPTIGPMMQDILY